MTAESEFDIESLPEEHRVSLARKGITKLGGVVEAYHNLEKLVGVDKVTKPVNGQMKEWFGEHKADLGVPEKPEAYTLPKIELPDGVALDKDMIARAQAFAHERNIPQDLFAEFAGFMLQENIDDHGRLADAMAASEATARADLQKEWGPDFDAKMERAKLAATALGYDVKFIDKLSQGFGSTAMAEHFEKLGGMLDEATLKTGDGGGDFPSDQMAAKGQIETLKQDAQFMSNLRGAKAVGHKEALEKWNRLHELAGDAMLPGEKKA